MRPGLGLLPPDGRHDAAMARMAKPMCAATDAEIPDEVDPADALSVTNQGRRNSCCGCATDKALERDHHIATGEIINLSARFSYLAARIIDGTNDGPDAGAMIEGGARGASEIGYVTEADFPYWNDDAEFDPTLPLSVMQLGSKTKAPSICRMRSMDEIIRFIGTGQGAVIYGIWWTEGLMNFRSSEPIRNSFGPGNVGGHALCIAGYKSIGGEKWPKTWNSHGKEWGDNGTMTTNPDLLWNAIAAAPWGAYGISAGAKFTKRPFKGFGGVF